MGLVVNGEVEDYRFTITPTAVDLLYFEATGETRLITLGWETGSEIDNMGFNLYRAASPDGPRTQINPKLIPSRVPVGSPYGAVYRYLDRSLREVGTYYYWLEAVSTSGFTNVFGPQPATIR